MSRQSGEYQNMPKYQPCPECGKPSKRVSKTLGGANYRCPTDGEFFVRAPQGRG